MPSLRVLAQFILLPLVCVNSHRRLSMQGVHHRCWDIGIHRHVSIFVPALSIQRPCHYSSKYQPCFFSSWQVTNDKWQRIFTESFIYADLVFTLRGSPDPESHDVHGFSDSATDRFKKPSSRSLWSNHSPFPCDPYFPCVVISTALYTWDRLKTTVQHKIIRTPDRSNVIWLPLTSYILRYLQAV